MYDLIVKNGNVVFSNKVFKCDIGIKSGIIFNISQNINETMGEKIIDASDKYVLSGMIDTHFHASDPGGVRSDWEGFETGSKALAAGGTTTYVDMPLNNLPATIDKETLLVKKERAEGRNYIDYAFFGGLVPSNLNNLEELNELGVVAYKCFMASCGSSNIENDFKNVDDYDLYLGMKKIAELDQMLCIHAENSVVTDRLGDLSIKNGNTSALDYVNSRPVFTEVEAVQRAILLAKETNCRVHFMHISTTEAVEVITKARAEGVRVSLESCPHYFVLSSEDFENIGTKCKCSPPLRSKQEQGKLWQDLMSSKIDILSSDHSPCPKYMKDYDDIFKAWGGISGCQNNVDIMFEEAVIKRGMDICEFSKLISLNPAKIYNIKNKGEIAVGNDADMILLDPNESYIIDEDKLYYRNKITPYNGRKVNCRITNTIVRGNLVYDYKEGIVSEPIGKLVLKSV